jgi:hypothetical protein
VRHPQNVPQKDTPLRLGKCVSIELPTDGHASGPLNQLLVSGPGKKTFCRCFYGILTNPKKEFIVENRKSLSELLLEVIAMYYLKGIIIAVYLRSFTQSQS